MTTKILFVLLISIINTREEIYFKTIDELKKHFNLSSFKKNNIGKTELKVKNISKYDVLLKLFNSSLYITEKFGKMRITKQEEFKPGFNEIYKSQDKNIGAYQYLEALKTIQIIINSEVKVKSDNYVIKEDNYVYYFVSKTILDASIVNKLDNVIVSKIDFSGDSIKIDLNCYLKWNGSFLIKSTVMSNAVKETSLIGEKTIEFYNSLF